MNWNDFIIVDQRVLQGKPVVKGTRLSVEFIMGLKAQGWTEQDIMDNYPRLDKEMLNAVYSYILESINDGLIIRPKESA